MNIDYFNHAATVNYIAWTRSPTAFSNDFFKRLLEEKWVEKKWKGPKQFVDKASGDLMMLPADMSLVKDKSFKKYVDLYAKVRNTFTLSARPEFVPFT
jgi:cytochrome c peroxidase